MSDHTFVCCQIKLPKPTLAVRIISYCKLTNNDKSAFCAELKDLSAELLFINDPNKLVDGYSEGLPNLLHKHAPTKTKTIIVRPCVQWFDDELKALKSHRRYTEKIWRTNKNSTNLVTFHNAINVYADC